MRVGTIEVARSSRRGPGVLALLVLLGSLVAITSIAEPAAAATFPLAPMPGKAIAAGSDFSCGVLATGKVECWGRNDVGQLGLNSTASTSTPSAVAGLHSVVAVSAADRNACALTADGGVACWGSNDADLLGNENTAPYSTVPVTPAGLQSGAVDIEVGDTYACAIKDDASLWCWGALDDDLGPEPIAVEVQSGVADVSIEGHHVCFTRTEGTVGCWGRGTSGELGIGGASSSATAKTPSVPGTVRQVATTETASCALTTTGAVSCWGAGTQNGTGSNTTVPELVSALGTDNRSIVGGDRTACAIKTDGDLWCWGAPRYRDEGWIGATTPRPVTDVGSGLVAVAASTDHLCGIDASGVGRCVGDPTVHGHAFYGALGTGTPTGDLTRAVPELVPGFESNVTAVAAGATHTCVQQSGAIRCVGAGTNFGSPASTKDTPPVTITGLGADPVLADAGDGSTCVTTANGMQCWGDGLLGQLGDGRAEDSATPVAVATAWTPSTLRPTSFSVGGTTVCATSSAAATPKQRAYCWGANERGQAGLGPHTRQTDPRVVGGNDQFANRISVGPDHSCYHSYNPTGPFSTWSSVRCTGRNDYGQIGATLAVRTEFGTPLSLPSSATGALDTYIPAVGLHHTCVAGPAVPIRCFGDNRSGQLGFSTWTAVSSASGIRPTGTPVGWAALAASSNTTCGLTVEPGNAPGSVWCWGDNTYGTVGNGGAPGPTLWDGSPGRPLPVVVLTGVSAISADPSGNTMCALKDGGVWCWGDASHGETGPVAQIMKPVASAGPFAHSSSVPVLSVSGSRTPLANGAGWSNAPVTVSFSCAGGWAPVSCPSPQVFGEGAGQVANGTATSGDGQSASASVAGISVDLTLPTAVASLGGSPVGGWYRGDVPVTWDCADALSGVASCPAATAITGEGAGRTVSGTVSDVAGNSRLVSSPAASIDRTAPSTAASSVPAWSGGDVVVHLSAVDALSGAASTEYAVDGGPVQQGTDVALSAEGVHGVTYRSTDVAGNVEDWRTVAVRIDRTAPTIVGASSPEPNANGWNQGDVTVTFTCDDGASGVASCEAPHVVTADGLTDVGGSVTDVAGNAASTVVSVRIDRTAPTVTASVAEPDGSDGWHRTPVSVDWSCSDATSGVATCSASVLLDADGDGQSATGTATDAAGNDGSATVSGVRIDRTAPIITATVTPEPDGSGNRAAPVTVHFTCTDATSGVASCPADQVVTASGSTLVTGTATDAAGNQASASVPVSIASPVAVTSSASPSEWKESVTLRATTTLGTKGTMAFYDGDVLLGTKSVSGGAASLVTATLAVGTHPITVRYQATASSPVVESGALLQVVQPAATSTALTPSVAGPVSGQTVSLKAVVTTVTAGRGTPAGTIDFYDGATLIGSKPLSGGVVALSWKATPGEHSFTARFQPTSSFGASEVTVDQAVGLAATTVVSTSSAPTAVLGRSGTITAKVTVVSPGTGSASGSVAFYDGDTLLVTAAVVSGKATMPLTLLGRGTHSITAVYLGDPNLAGSTAAPITQTIT